MTTTGHGPTVVMGTGGYAVELHGLLTDAGYDLIGFIGPDADADRLPGPWLGLDDAVAEQPTDALVFVAVAEPAIRRTLSARLAKMGRRPAGFVHERAWVSSRAAYADDVIIYPNTTIHAGVRLGEGVLVNSNVTIGHETEIGAFSNLNPGVALGGCVCIGEATYIGIGARTIENLTVAAGTVIGAGATVVSDISRPGTYVGTPARPITS